MAVAIFFYRGEGNYGPAAKQFSGVLNVQMASPLLFIVPCKERIFPYDHHSWRLLV